MIIYFINSSLINLRSNMANFKSINNQGSCPSLSDLYTKAKSANSITDTLDSSNVVDLDGLMGLLN